MRSVRSPPPVSATIVGGPPSTESASAAMPPRTFVRSRTIPAVSGMPMPCADTVGCRIRTFSSSMYSRSRARTYESNFAKLATPRRLSSGRDGRRSGLALAELASWRVRCYLDPALLAEVVDHRVEVLESRGLASLCARNHEDAVAAVHREGRPWPLRGACRDEREREARERQDDEHEDDKEDTKTTHIRRGLPLVVTLAGGLSNMTMVRALFLASLLGGLALAACGGAGSGGPYTSAAPATANPALGTNQPTDPPKQYPPAPP